MIEFMELKNFPRGYKKKYVLVYKYLQRYQLRVVLCRQSLSQWQTLSIPASAVPPYIRVGFYVFK
jgi:hypothetical protein